ncbi:MAG: FAD-dependent oxidoreductase [Rhodospirillales bacterium]
MKQQRFDLIVAGSGAAGLSAAVTAAESGARVAILERAPKDERGGNTRYTESFWRMQSKDEVADDFTQRLAENAGGWLDPEVTKDWTREQSEWPAILKAHPALGPDLIQTWGEQAGPTLRWLESQGVKFDFLPNYFITVSTTRMSPIGGGRAIVEALAARAEEFEDRVSYIYETAAERLIQDENGRIQGIIAKGPSGYISLEAPSVILATGGFQGNAEMMARYCGPAAQWTRPIARGGYYNRGEGITMGLQAGAAPAGDFGSFHAQPVDPRSGEAEPVVLTYSYGVLLNREGKRFTNEAPATVDATYEATSRDILKQSQGMAWAIVDGQIDDVPNWRKAVRSDQPEIIADTLDGLLAKLDIDATEARRTISSFNSACPDPSGFDPINTDGLAVTKLSPPKTHWSRQLQKPPFRAWPIVCATCFTFGGLKIDSSARVIDHDGHPIPGLYAAGETAGMYFRTYTGSTSVMRGCVFGRIAGAHAARAANQGAA